MLVQWEHQLASEDWQVKKGKSRQVVPSVGRFESRLKLGCWNGSKREEVSDLWDGEKVPRSGVGHEPDQSPGVSQGVSEAGVSQPESPPSVI